MKEGFIIYALGHRHYYQMAETLAVSLKFNNPEVNIALICDDGESVSREGPFNHIIHLDRSAFEVDGKLVFNKATICMYDHSPYDITIKLDADMIWLNGRDPMELFLKLDDYTVVHMNRGHGWNKGNSVWTEEENILNAYQFTDEDKLYKIYGEFVYFKKSSEARKYFQKVKSAFNKPRVKMVEGFANGEFTDELAFQIASMQMQLEYPENFTPVMNKYLGYKHFERIPAYQLPPNFYAYSIGGNSTPAAMRDQYNLLAKHYYRSMGLQNPYQVKDKKTFLPERKKR